MPSRISATPIIISLVASLSAATPANSQALSAAETVSPAEAKAIAADAESEGAA
jgi:hypothetical protein